MSRLTDGRRRLRGRGGRGRRRGCPQAAQRGGRGLVGEPAAATEGPLVSDEQWNADRRYVAANLRPRRVEGHDMPVIDMGEGEAILYIPFWRTSRSSTPASCATSAATTAS